MAYSCQGVTARRSSLRLGLQGPVRLLIGIRLGGFGGLRSTGEIEVHLASGRPGATGKTQKESRGSRVLVGRSGAR